MTRTEILKTRLVAIGNCFLLIGDLALNLACSFVLMIWAVATKQEGAPPSAYETMSARAGRGMLNRKPLACAFGWCVDRVFDLWQGPVADLPDGRIFEHPSHCVRAMVKTRHGAYLPADYHRPLPASIAAGFRDAGAPNERAS